MILKNYFQTKENYSQPHDRGSLSGNLEILSLFRFSVMGQRIFYICPDLNQKEVMKAYINIQKLF